MALEPMPTVDTRAYFRPLAAELIGLLRALPADAWDRPTIAPAWRVRDVVAHLVDTSLRRLSFHRDGLAPPAPAAGTDLIALVNALNAQWVEAARRLSPRVLTDLYALASSHLAGFVEQLPLDAPPLFPVSWAGDDGNHGWLDIGREFTEQWHHQAQVRDAVGAPPLSNVEWLRAFLLIALRGLPHAYRGAHAPEGTAIVVEIAGRSGGAWTLMRAGDRWRLWAGEDAAEPSARAVMPEDAAWRLLFNALPPDRVPSAVEIRGDPALIRPLLAARSVIV